MYHFLTTKLTLPFEDLKEYKVLQEIPKAVEPFKSVEKYCQEINSRTCTDFWWKLIQQWVQAYKNAPAYITKIQLIDNYCFNNKNESIYMFT